MKKLIFAFLIFFNVTVQTKEKIQYDCFIIGFINQFDGIGQISSSFINCLTDLKLQFINLGDKNKNIPDNASDLIKKSIKFKKKIFKKMTAKVAIFTELLWSDRPKKITDKILRFAYSMTECNKISQHWVKNLNQHFDGVIVPDEYFIDIYKKSGVEIPIFVLPMALDLNNFFKCPLKNKKNKPFVFGCSAGFWPRKNHEMLMQAFHEEFGDDSNFKLILHGRDGQHLPHIENKLKELNVSNITLINKILDQKEYINFLQSLDCYVLISKGEGFSITPREALSLGIPCILTNNTAQKTICKSNLVYPVETKIAEQAYCERLEKNVGYNFNCEINDVKKALRNIFNNYERYLKLSRIGRIWVQKYTPESLKKKYLTLINPKQVILTNKNIIADSYIMTDSKNLYEKYNLLFKKT